MYPTSNEFQSTIIDDHRSVVKCELLVDDVNTTEITDIVDGIVTLDSTAAIRGSCQVTLVDSDGRLTPTEATDLLMPYGNEIKLSRGVKLRVSGDEEFVPLGIFLITRTTISETPEGLVIQLDGYDRAKRFEYNRLTAPYKIASGTNVVTAIQELLESKDANVEFASTTTNYTTPKVVLEEQTDVWSGALQLAQAIGYTVYFDNDGLCRIEPVPDIDDSPVVWTYDTSQVTSTLLGIEQTFDRELTYNHVIASGETSGTTAPVRGEAFDNDPESPTNIDGKLGDVPYFMVSPFIVTADQAEDAARRQLQKVIGGVEEMSFNAIVNPAHQPDDFVLVKHTRTYADGEDVALVDAVYALDAVTIPLAPAGVMSARTRRRRITSE